MSLIQVCVCIGVIPAPSPLSLSHNLSVSLSLFNINHLNWMVFHGEDGVPRCLCVCVCEFVCVESRILGGVCVCILSLYLSLFLSLLFSFLFTQSLEWKYRRWWFMNCLNNLKGGRSHPSPPHTYNIILKF